jgi:hypothetical protein
MLWVLWSLIFVGVVGEIVIQGSDVTLPAIPTTACHTRGIRGGPLLPFTMKNVTVVHSGWLAIEIDKLPSAPTGVTNPAVVIRTRDGESAGVYPDGIARIVQDRGYVLVIETNKGDITWTGHFGLHASGTYNCPIPTLLLPDVPYADILNQFGSPLILESVTYDVNPEIAFIEGPVYIIGISIPLYTIASIMAFLSVRALWRNGFPYIVNAGSALCILGLGMSMLMCKLLVVLLHF